MFRTEALRQRIELINHLIEFGRQIILIQGASGYGKTTLIDALEETAEPGWVIIRFKAGPTLNRESLLEKISASLDFEPTERFSEEEVCSEIHRRLEILDKSNQIVVVVIDDAHELPSDTHSLLLALAHDDDAAAEIRVVLAANNSDSSLLDHLQTSAVEKALTHTVDLPKMDREQTASLLSWWQDQQHSAPGANSDDKFSSATIDEIYAHSEGVPGNIVVLARQHRLRGNNTQLRADPVKKYLILGGIALLAVTLFSFFGKDVSEHEEQDLIVELPDSVAIEITEPALTPLPETEDLPLVPLSDKNPSDKDPNDKSSPDQHNVQSPDDLSDDPVHNPNPAVAGQQEPLNAANLDQRLPSQPNQVPAPVENTGRLEDMLNTALFDEVARNDTSEVAPNENRPAPDTQEEQQQTPITAPVAVEANDNMNPPPVNRIEPNEPASEIAITQEPTPTIEPKISVKLREQSAPVAKLEKPKALPAPESAPPQPKVKNPANKSKYSLANLLRESPNGYVLQLIGVRDHDAAAKYIDKHSITAKSTVVASMHRGEPWYVVIYGQFDSREQAVAAAGGVKEALPNVKPWPRPISSLK